MNADVPRIRTLDSRSGHDAPRESDQALGVCDILSAIHIPVCRWVCDDGGRQGYIHDQRIRRTLLRPCDRGTHTIFWTHTHQYYIS